MTEKPENPRAFPLAVNDVGDAGYEGMSLRDYFADSALGKLQFNISEKINRMELEERAAIVASACYIVADSMLKARAL